MLSNILFQMLGGLSSSMFLWLVAAGLTLAFGVCGILNIAHGSLYMLGAYFCFTFYHSLGANFWLSIVLACVGVGILAFIMERFFLRHLYPEPLEFQLILTFAFILILNHAVQLGWGTMLLLPPMPSYFMGTVPVLGRPFPIYNLFIIGVGFAVGAVIWIVLDKTWWGRKVIASASNREMAGALGINIPRIFTTAFIFAAALAAFGGALTTPVRVCLPGTGESIIVQAFVVTVIGGLGSLKGALLGAIIVGVISAVCTLIAPFFELFAMYAIMAVVLLVRPRGIFGGAA
jgi:branched-chain amino acid transport system permease protein